MLEKNQFNIIPPLEKKENSCGKLDVEIRIAIPEEWEKLRDFRLNLLNDESGNSYVATPKQVREIKQRTDKQWKDILFGGDNFSVIAFKDSKVVGMGRVEKRKEIWYLYNLGVKKELRRKGIGSEITAVRLKEIKNQGGKEIRAFIKKINKGSFKIAESFGFRRNKTPIGWLRNLMVLDDVNSSITTKRIEEVLNEK